MFGTMRPTSQKFLFPNKELELMVIVIRDDTSYIII